jgi:predicted secreted protein
MALFAEYEGVLPCADCKGVRTELALYDDPSGAGPQTFELRETYVGTKDGIRVFETRGKWSALRGKGKDKDAIIYQLNPDKPNDVRYFIRVDDRLIRQLDRKQNEIKTPLNYTLNRKIRTVVVTEVQNGERVRIGPGDTLVVQLKSNPSTGYNWVVADSDQSLMKLTGDSGKPGDNNLPGEPGTQSMRFQAVGSGIATIRLNYLRPFEKDKEPAQKFELTVEIK